MLLIPGKKTGAAAGSLRPEVPTRLGTMAHPRIRRPRMPQTVLGLGVAVVGAFREALDVYLGANFFWDLVFRISTTGVSLLRSTDVKCIENTGTT